MFDFLRKRKRDDYAGAARKVGFIVGTGRCGTTILAQVLNSHSRICVPHELQILVSIGNGDRLYEKWQSGEMSRFKARHFIRLIERCCPFHFEQFFDYRRHFRELSYPQNDPAVIARDLFDHICHSSGTDVFIEQTPWHGQRLEVLKQWFPEMKVVHVVRDARDVAVSYARTPWWSKDVAANLLQWEKEVTAIHKFGVENPAGFLEVRYEDLVLNPESELTKILALFDLPFEAAILDPDRLINYEAMFKDQSLLSSPTLQSKEYKKWNTSKRDIFFPESVYSWKKGGEVDYKQLSAGISGTLQLFGYDI